MTSPRVLLLDHADSFVFVLADQIARLGAEVETVRADMPLPTWLRLLDHFAPALVVLSPGPGHPAEAATTMAWLHMRPPVPVLGICLGHQAIAIAAGGRVVRGQAPMHGVSSQVDLAPSPLFADLPRRLPVARYHSLVVTDLPPCLEVLGRANDAVMAIAHRELPWLGFQFHPESVLTPHGSLLLRAVLRQAAGGTVTTFANPHP